MNIIIEQKKFLPHCSCQLNLTLHKNKINLIKGVNGIGKSTLAHVIKEQYFNDLTLIEQVPLQHFYNRTLRDLKDIFIAARPHYFDSVALKRLWELFDLERISHHYLQNLSGGENQSLKLALGLSVKNKIIIIDEPSQYLDVHRRNNLARYLKELMKDHFVIVIEHESSWLTELDKNTVELYLDQHVLKANYV